MSVSPCVLERAERRVNVLSLSGVGYAVSHERSPPICRLRYDLDVIASINRTVTQVLIKRSSSKKFCESVFGDGKSFYNFYLPNFKNGRSKTESN